MPRSTTARIDLDALRNNYRAACERAGSAKTMAVVKRMVMATVLPGSPLPCRMLHLSTPLPALKKRWLFELPAFFSQWCCSKVCMPLMILRIACIVILSRCYM